MAGSTNPSAGESASDQVGTKQSDGKRTPPHKPDRGSAAATSSTRYINQEGITIVDDANQEDGQERTVLSDALCQTSITETETPSPLKDAKDEDKQWKDLYRMHPEVAAALKHLGKEMPWQSQTMHFDLVSRRESIALFNSGPSGIGKTLAAVVDAVNTVNNQKEFGANLDASYEKARISAAGKLDETDKIAVECDTKLVSVIKPLALIVVPSHLLCEQVSSTLRGLVDATRKETGPTGKVIVVEQYLRSAPRPSKRGKSGDNTREPVDILIGTAGRLMGEHNANRLDFSNLKIVIFDDAKTLMGKDIKGEKSEHIRQVLTHIIDDITSPTQLRCVFTGQNMPLALIAQIEKRFLSKLGMEAVVLAPDAAERPEPFLEFTEVCRGIKVKHADTLAQLEEAHQTPRMAALLEAIINVLEKNGPDRSMLIVAQNWSTVSMLREALLKATRLPAEVIRVVHGYLLHNARKEHLQQFNDVDGECKILISTPFYAASGMKLVCRPDVIVYNTCPSRGGDPLATWMALKGRTGMDEGVAGICSTLLDPTDAIDRKFIPILREYLEAKAKNVPEFMQAIADGEKYDDVGGNGKSGLKGHVDGDGDVGGAAGSVQED